MSFGKTRVHAHNIKTIKTRAHHTQRASPIENFSTKGGFSHPCPRKIYGLRGDNSPLPISTPVDTPPHNTHPEKKITLPPFYIYIAVYSPAVVEYTPSSPLSA